MNEPGNNGNNSAETVPLDAKTFRRWRKKHTFPTPELAARAELVERDLELLPQLGPHNAGTREIILTSLAVFASAMEASR